MPAAAASPAHKTAESPGKDHPIHVNKVTRQTRHPPAATRDPPTHPPGRGCGPASQVWQTPTRSCSRSAAGAGRGEAHVSGQWACGACTCVRACVRGWVARSRTAYDRRVVEPPAPMPPSNQLPSGTRLKTCMGSQFRSGACQRVPSPTTTTHNTKFTCTAQRAHLRRKVGHLGDRLARKVAQQRVVPWTDAQVGVRPHLHARGRGTGGAAG